jgi:hypothetical protein
VGFTVGVEPHVGIGVDAKERYGRRILRSGVLAAGEEATPFGDPHRHEDPLTDDYRSVLRTLRVVRLPACFGVC